MTMRTGSITTNDTSETRTEAHLKCQNAVVCKFGRNEVHISTENTFLHILMHIYYLCVELNVKRNKVWPVQKMLPSRKVTKFDKMLKYFDLKLT